MSSPISKTSVDPLWDHQAFISPTQVQLGHFIARLDIPWEETPFELQGLLVTTRDIRQWLIQHCTWVVVDLELSRLKTPLPNHAVLRPTSPRKTHSPKQGLLSHPANILRRAPLDRTTMKTALRSYVALSKQVRRLTKAFREGGRMDLATASAVVNELSDALEHNISAMVWLTRIKQQDNYTAEHCINVAVLAMGLAHALEWDRSNVELAGVAGLLHDLGKMKLDPAILNKPSRLTPDEFEHLKTHARLGYQLLTVDPHVPIAVTEAVRDHHERPDGRGYPFGKQAHEVKPLSTLVSVVDAYDAITSHRVYDAARSHHEALSILWQNRGRQFNSHMVEAFIQFMGWVTPGTLVRLSNCELAVVVRARPGKRLLPDVRVLRPVIGGYEVGDFYNLAARMEATGDLQLHIAQVLPDGAEGIDLKRLSLDIFPP